MIFDILNPARGPGGVAIFLFAVAHPIYVSNSHTKFGWISPNALGGLYNGHYNIPFAFFFLKKKRGDNDEKEITPKICKAELWFLHMMHCLSVLYNCIKFHPNSLNTFKLGQNAFINFPSSII